MMNDGFLFAEILLLKVNSGIETGASSVFLVTIASS